MIPRVCTRELVTTDVVAAERFYGELVGWTFADGHRFAGRVVRDALHLDARVAGLVEAFGRTHGRAAWGVVVEVEAVAPIVERATTLGGRVLLGPVTSPGLGTFAVIVDPSGATFSVLTPEPPLAPPARGFGMFGWDILGTPDFDLARRFYAGVFGWVIDDHASPRIRDPETSVAFANLTRLPSPEVPSHWLSIIAVQALAPLRVRAVELGGQVIVPSSPVGDEGRLAVLRDPAGAVFGVFEPTSA